MILPPPDFEREGNPAMQCRSVDPLTGAACTRPHHDLSTRHSDMSDWRIELVWAEPPAELLLAGE